MDNLDNFVSDQKVRNYGYLIMILCSIMGSACFYYYVCVKACCARKRCKCVVQCCETIPEYHPIPIAQAPAPSHAMPVPVNNASQMEGIPIPNRVAF